MIEFEKGFLDYVKTFSLILLSFLDDAGITELIGTFVWNLYDPQTRVLVFKKLWACFENQREEKKKKRYLEYAKNN